MKNLPIQSPSFQYIEKSFKEWLDILGYSQHTVVQLPVYVRSLFYYLEQHGITQIQQLEIHHIRDHYNELRHRDNIRFGGGLSNSYLNKHLQGYYKFIDYLRQSGRLVLPPLGINLEENDTEEIIPLTQEEIKDLYKATYGYNEGTILEPFNARDRAMLTVFYGCGLRANEGYSLNLSDVNFDKQVVYVRHGKNYKERLVPFNRSGAKYLEEYVYDWRPVLLTKDKNEGAFFISQRGTRMVMLSMSLRVKLLRDRTNNIELQQKNVRLHILRHSIATHLLQNGMALEKVSHFLGHSSLESTQVYTHLVTKENLELREQPYNTITSFVPEQLFEDEL